MQPAGFAAFEKREESKSRIYAYENEPIKLLAEFEDKFKANKKAWSFFESQAASYQKTITNWAMSAKQEATRISRFEKLVAKSEAGQKM